MKAEHHTKKSLKASGLALLLCIAMLIGTTFAWFTDSITNSGNKIEAGNLDVTLSEWNGEAYVEVTNEPIFDYDKWEPGYTDAAAVKIENKGSLALKYKVDFVSEETSETANKLAQVIDVYYLKGGIAPENMPNSFEDLTKKDFQKLGTLSDFLNKKEGAATGKLKATASDYAIIALHMQESASNEYQDLNVGQGFDIVINATQLNMETDGFGNPDYDMDAENPVVVSTPAELEQAVKEGGTVELKKDMTLKTPLSLTSEKVKIDLNDKKLTAKGTGHAIEAKGTAEVTVSDGKLSSANENAAVVFAQGSAKVSVENCDIEYSAKGGYAVCTNGSYSKDTVITMRNTNITYKKGYACYFPAGNITLKNCNVKGAVIISGGDVTIDGGTYTADGFAGQNKIWHKADTIDYMAKFSEGDGCGHMGDSVLIMDRRNSGYDMRAITIKNATFNTELTLKDNSKATAYAIKYVDYDNVPDAARVNYVIENNTYNHKLADGSEPLMFIGIKGEEY